MKPSPSKKWHNKVMWWVGYWITLMLATYINLRVFNYFGWSDYTYGEYLTTDAFQVVASCIATYMIFRLVQAYIHD